LRRELEAGGFCGKTALLCSALSEGGDDVRLRQNAQRRLTALRKLESNIDNDAARLLCLDGGAFLAKSKGWKGSLKEWLQAASQEPDRSFFAGSFLSRGAASTAQLLGLALVQWVGKPQGRYPGFYTLPGHSQRVNTVALSRNGKRAASGAWDKFVKIWNAETGAEVRAALSECVEGDKVMSFLVSGDRTHILHTKR